MIGLYLSIPIASFRPGAAREFWETHPLPPPSTVYGFLLAMVGEADRSRHLGARCTAGLLNKPDQSTVLRKLWRIKELGEETNATQGNKNNVRPDYQRLLTGIRLVVFLDSTQEIGEGPTLEERVLIALDPNRRGQIDRFGGLSLGESTHMVDEVSPLSVLDPTETRKARVFLNDPKGNMTLPVWVDHVGRKGTRYVTGRLRELGSELPQPDQIPRIDDGVMETASPSQA